MIQPSRNDKSWQPLLWFLIMYFLAEPLRAKPIIEVSDETTFLKIGRQVSLLEDRQGTLTLDEARHHTEWVTSQVDEPNFGYSRSTWWVHAQISFTDTATRDFYLLLDDAVLNQVDVFFIDAEQNVFKRRGGGYVPVSERDQPYRSHVFLLPGKGERSVDVYIRLRSQLAVVIPLQIIESGHFAQINTTIAWVYSLYLGFLSAMLLFNLIVGIRMRETSNLYYSGFTLSMILFGLSFSGYGRQFLWRTAPDFDNFMLVFSVSMCGIFPTLFNEKFLFNMRREISSVPYFSRFIVCILGGMAIISGLLGEYHTGIMISTACIIICVIFFLINSIIGVVSNVHGAKLLLIAWSGILVGAFVFSMRAFGWLPSNVFTTYSIQYACMIESFLLMVAIIDKSRHIRANLDAANEAAKRELQQQVEARTSALKQTQQQFINNERRQSLAVFAAGVAHEINNPVNFIAVGAQDALARSQDLHAMLKDMLDEDADPQLVKDIEHRFAAHARHYRTVLDNASRIAHAVAELRAQNPERRQSDNGEIHIPHV